MTEAERYFEINKMWEEFYKSDKMSGYVYKLFPDEVQRVIERESLPTEFEDTFNPETDEVWCHSTNGSRIPVLMGWGGYAILRDGTEVYRCNTWHM